MICEGYMDIVEYGKKHQDQGYIYLQLVLLGYIQICCQVLLLDVHSYFHVTIDLTNPTILTWAPPQKHEPLLKIA